MISLKEVLKHLHTLELCSITVVSYDKRRKDKTGQLRTYEAVKLVWGDENKPAAPAQGERPMTALERSISGMDDIDRRKPNHSAWYTRNVRVYQGGMPTEMIVKIHPLLIIEFNGQTTCA